MRRLAASALFACVLLAGIPPLPGGLSLVATVLAFGEQVGNDAVGNGTVVPPMLPDAEYNETRSGGNPATGLSTQVVGGAGNAEGKKQSEGSRVVYPVCRYGGYPFALPRYDDEQGSPQPRPNSIGSHDWAFRIFEMMRDRVIASSFGSSVSVAGPTWGLGLADLMREALYLRLDSGDGYGQSADAALSLNPSSTGAVNNAGAWRGSGDDGGANSFFHDFYLAGQQAVVDPDPALKVKSELLSLPLAGFGGLGRGLLQTYHVYFSGDTQGPQRLYLANDSLWPNSRGDSDPLPGTGGIWYGGASSENEQTVDGVWNWKITQTKCHDVTTTTSSTDPVTGETTSTSTTERVCSSSPYASDSVTYHQTTAEQYFTPADLINKMGKYRNLDQASLTAPYRQQDLSQAVPDSPGLPVGPRANAVSQLNKDIGLTDGDGHGPAVEYYLRWPNLREVTIDGKVFYRLGSPAFTVHKVDSVEQLEARHKVVISLTHEPELPTVPGRWNDGEYEYSYSINSNPYAGLASRSDSLRAAGRLYINVRKSSREAGFAVFPTISSYIGLSATAATSEATPGPTVFRDFLQVLDQQNAQRYTDTATTWRIGDAGSRAPGEPGPANMARWIYYPVAMSPFDEGDRPVADIGTARLKCGDEAMTLAPVDYSHSEGSTDYSPGFAIEPAGVASHAAFPRAMTSPYTGCDMARVTSVADAPDRGELQHCWFRWKPLQISTPKLPGLAFLLKNNFHWIKGLHPTTGTPSKGLLTDARGNPVYHFIEPAATVGQRYLLRVDPTIPIDDTSPQSQPLAFLNYKALTSGAGVAYINGTQVGVTYELGNQGLGGKILEVYVGDSRTPVTMVSRSMTNPAGLANLRSVEASIVFEETPSSYMQKHPQCMTYTPELLVTNCGIAYDPGSKTYFYQIRIRTWWDPMWGNDPNNYPNYITAFGLPWFSGRSASGADLWALDPAYSKLFVRPWNGRTWPTEAVPLPYTNPGVPMVFDQGTPMLSSSWKCVRGGAAAGLRCPRERVTEPPGVIPDGGGADRYDGKPAKKPGWGTYNLPRNPSSLQALWGYGLLANSWRPLVDSSIYCAEASNAYVTVPRVGAGSTSRPWESACLYNIPVVQAQRT